MDLSLLCSCTTTQRLWRLSHQILLEDPLCQEPFPKSPSCMVWKTLPHLLLYLALSTARLTPYFLPNPHPSHQVLIGNNFLKLPCICVFASHNLLALDLSAYYLKRSIYQLWTWAAETWSQKHKCSSWSYIFRIKPAKPVSVIILP